MYVILQVPEETNILTDGCLIDLCGVTLMWRTAIGLEQGPVSIGMHSLVNHLCVPFPIGTKFDSPNYKLSDISLNTLSDFLNMLVT